MNEHFENWWNLHNNDHENEMALNLSIPHDLKKACQVAFEAGQLQAEDKNKDYIIELKEQISSLRFKNQDY